MREGKWLAILLLSLTMLFAAGVLLAGGDVEAGKAVYQKKCATCHGKDGEGNPKMAQMLKVELRHLGSKEVQEKTDEQLRKESVEGVGKMKPVKGMSEADIENLMAYLRSLKKK